MNDLRVGLIGYGLGGATFHAPFIAITPGLELDAIVTANAERRQQAERDHPGVRLLDRAEALWAPGAGIDVVVVASPNRTHVPLGLAALEAGLPVVIDKPFAPSVVDAERLIEAAERRHVMLAPYHNRRWDGDFLTLRALVATGALGAVHRFESRFERWRPQRRGGWKESTAPDDAAGLLFDLGTHVIDQALVLFGPAVALHAELDSRRPGARVDDDVFVALQHESGVRSHVWVSAVAASPAARFRVLGSNGAYTKHGLDPQEGMLRAGVRPDAPGFGEEPRDHWGTTTLGGEARPLPTHRGDYGRFYAGVVAAVRDGAPSPVDAREALMTVALIERIKKTWGRRDVRTSGSPEV